MAIGTPHDERDCVGVGDEFSIKGIVPLKGQRMGHAIFGIGMPI